MTYKTDAEHILQMLDAAISAQARLQLAFDQYMAAEEQERQNWWSQQDQGEEWTNEESV